MKIRAGGGKHQRNRDYQYDPGGKTIDSVQEVDRVLHPKQPEEADRSDQQSELHQVSAGKSEELDLKLEGDHSHNRYDHLHAELDRRAHAPAVVCDEQDGR
jgi:hypothetical protein